MMSILGHSWMAVREKISSLTGVALFFFFSFQVFVTPMNNLMLWTDLCAVNCDCINMEVEVRVSMSLLLLKDSSCQYKVQQSIYTALQEHPYLSILKAGFPYQHQCLYSEWHGEAAQTRRLSGLFMAPSPPSMRYGRHPGRAVATCPLVQEYTVGHVFWHFMGCRELRPGGGTALGQCQGDILPSLGVSC